MATEAQVAANRLNAQKSSGPRTAEGKAVVAQNAVKHGLLAREGVLRGKDWPCKKKPMQTGSLRSTGLVGEPDGAQLRPPEILSRCNCKILSTTASIESAEESSTCESGAGTSGASGRFASRASRSARSRERARRLALIPFSINCL